MAYVLKFDTFEEAVKFIRNRKLPDTIRPVYVLTLGKFILANKCRYSVLKTLED